MDDHLELISAKFELQLKEYEEDYLRTKKFDDPNYLPEPTSTLAAEAQEQLQGEEPEQPYQQLNSSGDDYNSTSHNTNGNSDNEAEENQSNEEASDADIEFREERDNYAGQTFTVNTQIRFGHKGEIDTSELKSILEKHRKNKKNIEMNDEKVAQIKELMRDIPQPKAPAWAVQISDEDLLKLAKSFLDPKPPVHHLINPQS